VENRLAHTGMEILTSPLLDRHQNIRHAFLTRNGGTSNGLYQSLNCARASRDQVDAVSTNLERVAARVGVTATALWSPKQVHSPRVLTVDQLQTGPRPEADGTVTRTQGLALSVMGADCAPVLFSSPEGGVIGATHAGWKGALDGVLEATVAAFEKLGAPAQHIDAAIGPCIQRQSYEVGAEFRDRFLDSAKSHEQFFDPEPGNKYLFHLPGFIEHRLERAGLREVDRLGADTLSEEDRFFSYRRATLRGETDCGRQMSVITLK
jgi:hypothetical protein